MGADWSGFESKMKKWFSDVGMKSGTPGKDDGKSNKDTGKTAGLIADEYEKAIKSYRAAQKIYPLLDAAKKMIPELQELIKDQAV